MVLDDKYQPRRTDKPCHAQGDQRRHGPGTDTADHALACLFAVVTVGQIATGRDDATDGVCMITCPTCQQEVKEIPQTISIRGTRLRVVKQTFIPKRYMEAGKNEVLFCRPIPLVTVNK